MQIAITVEVEEDARAGMTLYEILQGFSPSDTEHMTNLNVDDMFYYGDTVVINRVS